MELVRCKDWVREECPENESYSALLLAATTPSMSGLQLNTTKDSIWRIPANLKTHGIYHQKIQSRRKEENLLTQQTKHLS